MGPFRYRAVKRRALICVVRLSLFPRDEVGPKVVAGSLVIMIFGLAARAPAPKDSFLGLGFRLQEAVTMALLTQPSADVRQS